MMKFDTVTIIVRGYGELSHWYAVGYHQDIHVHCRKGVWSMKVWKKNIAGLLVVSSIWIGLGKAPICHAATLLAQADMAPITRHEPRIMFAAEKDIPASRATDGEKKGVGNWVWIGLGVLAVGGLALAIGGGGGDDESSSPPNQAGSVTVGW